MLVESLLPLGKLDPGLRRPDRPLDIRTFAEGARVAEEVGLDAILVEETKDDPFQLLALGATTTSTIQLGTSVAMAFPRSPTVTAMSAWSLQKLSGGRLTLGLGTRDIGAVEICVKPLVGTAPDEGALAQVATTVRERVAFYLSTPSYRRAFELHGWGETAVQASRLSRAQRWDDLAALVDDEMLHTVASIGPFDEIAGILNERYAGRVDRVEFSTPVTTPDDADRLRQILSDIA